MQITKEEKNKPKASEQININNLALTEEYEPMYSGIKNKIDELQKQFDEIKKEHTVPVEGKEGLDAEIKDLPESALELQLVLKNLRRKKQELFEHIAGLKASNIVLGIVNDLQIRNHKNVKIYR